MSLGPLAALCSALTWALGCTAYARVTETTPPSAINFTRALLALPAFLLTLTFTEHGWGAFTYVTPSHVSWLFVSILASYVIGDVFFLFSTVHVGAPAALAIASSYPIWSALAGWLLLGEPIASIKVAAVGGVVGGVAIVILSGVHLARRPHYARGILFAIITSLCWALNTVAIARGGAGIDASAVNVVRMSMALMLCPLVGWWLKGKPTFLIPPIALRRYGWIFFAEAYGGSFCFVYGLTHAPLAIASALSSLAPIIATPIAWSTRREPVSLVKFGGIILVVLGAYFLVT